MQHLKSESPVVHLLTHIIVAFTSLMGFIIYQVCCVSNGAILCRSLFLISKGIFMNGQQPQLDFTNKEWRLAYLNMLLHSSYFGDTPKPSPAGGGKGRGSQLLKGCSPRQCSNNRICDRSASLTAQRTPSGKWRPGRKGQTAFRANFPTKAADPRAHLRRAATELPGYPLTKPPPPTLPYGRAHRNRLCRLCAPLEWHILHINIVAG